MSDSFQVIYSPEAIDDLFDIYSYIAYELQVPATAEKQVNRIREMIRSLDSMPEKYAGVDWEPWKSRNMRRVPVYHFLIFYTVNYSTNTVTVIRIVYAGQDIAAFLDVIARSEN